MTYTVHEIDNNVPMERENLEVILENYATNEDIQSVNDSIDTLESKLAGKANVDHDHDISDVSHLDNTLSNKLDKDQTYTYTSILSDANSISQLDNPNLTQCSINSIYNVSTENDNLVLKYGNTVIATYLQSVGAWSYSHTHTTSDITDLDLSNYATASHTHTSFNKAVTISASTSNPNEDGNALTLYGNTYYSRFNVAKNSTSGSAIYGYDDIAKTAYIKVSGATTELNVYKTKVKINSDLEVTGTITGQSLTITHRAPIVEPLENYQIGYPAFAHSVQGEVTPTDCIPSVKSSGTYREYLGIIVRINEATPGDEEHDPTPASIDFATHGDYLFHVNNSANYHIGDILTYDGNIIADDTFINSKIMTSIVGKVMGIIDEHTVAVFKQ